MRLYVYAPGKVGTHRGEALAEGLMVWKGGDKARISPLYRGFITFSNNGVRI